MNNSAFLKRGQNEKHKLLLGVFKKNCKVNFVNFQNTMKINTADLPEIRRKEKKMKVKISKSDFMKLQVEVARKLPFRLNIGFLCALSMYQTMLQIALFQNEGEENDDRTKE